MEHRKKIPFRDRIIYFFKHNTTHEIADLARSRLLIEYKLFTQFKNVVGSERLEQIATDPNIQKKYAALMKMGRSGGKKAQLADLELAELPLDLRLGFLEFKRKYLEEKFNLKFISEEDNIDY